MMRLDDAAAKALTGPAAIDGVGPAGGMEEYWKDADARRRRQCAWTQARAA